MTIEKIDHKKQLKHLYHAPTSKVVEVDVPAMNYLMLDGKGDPNTALEFQEGVEVLNGLSYALKFASKKSGLDYAVMPLEGLWWMEEMGKQYGDLDFAADKSLWLWTIMMMQPDPITPEMVEVVTAELRRKKNPPALDKVRFERFDEGFAVQTMHIGSYDDEAPTIDRIHGYIDAQGYALTGRHHEIYLGDPRRAQPEKLRTIIRQPARRK